MKKIALFALAALMGLALMLTATGCGASDAANEKLIRDGLTEEFNEVKDPDSALWAGVPAELPSDIFNAWLGSYNFEIGEVKINGTTAEATVKVTGKQLLVALESAQDELLNGDPAELEALTDDEFEEKLYELIAAELDKLDTVSTEIVLTYALVGDTWTPTNDTESSKKLEETLLGGE
ncbi:MAG: hypothetical protein LBP24_05140 [Coriobacteriales bacterium]|nr:hypothetical protein [Coriobacteriales bacterium]